MRQKLVFFQLIMLLLLWGIQACSAQEMPTPSSGEIIRHADFPSQFVGKRHIDVWLPEGYSEDKSWAVLYMHDGQNLFDSTVTWNHQEWMVDETISSLIESGQIRPVIVVGIFNNGKMRSAEYFPEKAFRTLKKSDLNFIADHVDPENLEQFSNTICSDQYLKFLVQELKPFIDSTYNTKRDRSNTFIAGSSMGGLISMYAICEYPGVFAAAGCLSTHWPGFIDFPGNPVPGAFVQYLDENLPPPETHKMWFDHGTETLDSTYGQYQERVDPIMRNHGYGAENWTTRVYPGTNHSERAWQERFDEVLLFLLKD